MNEMKEAMVMLLEAHMNEQSEKVVEKSIEYLNEKGANNHTLATILNELACRLLQVIPKRGLSPSEGMHICNQSDKAIMHAYHLGIAYERLRNQLIEEKAKDEIPV